MPVPQIQLIEASSDELVAALAKLLPLVSSRATPLTAERLDLELDFVNLTSRPSRVAANQLYRSVGFKVRETNCYRYDLRPAPSTLVSS